MSVTGARNGAVQAVGGRLRPVAGEVLESLYQHRLLTTGQLREIHVPYASARWMQRVLCELATEGLVGFVRVGHGALRAWHLTEQGAELAESVPDRVEDRRKVLDPRQASGPLQAHTLAVNEAGLCFLRAARARGDEFSARSWRHEVAHPIGPAPGMRRGELLIADAVFAYLLVEEHEVRFQYRFLELDRGTMPLDKLVRKLARYARLYRFRPRAQRRGEDRPPPAWKAHYAAFPIILVCFADRPRTVLERRCYITAQLCATEPELEAAPSVRFSFCLLDDLREQGPFASIFIEAHSPDELVDWLGRNSDRGDVGATEAPEPHS